MPTIQFNRESQEEIFEYEYFPIIEISTVDLRNPGNDWFNRFIPTLITIFFEGYDAQNNSIGRVQHPISLGSYTSPYTTSSKLEINQRAHYVDRFPENVTSSAVKWKVTVRLSNWEFSENEFFLAVKLPLQPLAEGGFINTR